MSRRSTRTVLDTTDLAGRTAVVTGAGSGIGRSLALLLARRGATVRVADVDRSRADGVAAEIAAAAGTAVAHEVDVTDAAAVAALADEVFTAGAVDLLFNNAGVGHAGAVVDTTLEDWRRPIDLNRTPYSATKYAVVGLTEGLDLELAGTSVTTSARCPGVIATDIIRTSTMRGDWAGRRVKTVDFYARRGTSPDVVARQALDSIGRRIVVPTPRYQVVPPWLLKRLAPRASRGLSAVGGKFLAR